jgi:light-regulated signal transduction histidine kinase (bacteriophytochrome)
MDKQSEKILETFASLLEEGNWDEATKASFLALHKELKKTLHRNQFKLDRTLKDKAIAIRLLNQTISDLQKHQQLLEKSNQVLYDQKKEIEAQKEIVEEQSKQLANRLDELQMSYSELERFAYFASHDLRAPLRTITSFSEILGTRYLNNLDKDAQTFASYLNNGARQMNDIVDALLEYSRVGRMNDEFKETNLSFTFERALYDLRKLVEEKNATIKADNLPIAIVSKGAMRKLFYHLIKNILVYSSANSFHINLSCKEQDRYYKFLLTGDNNVLEEVFPSHLFEDFRIDTPGGFPDKGISVAICKKVILLHYGIIYVEKDGEGHASVIFTIEKK